jgi:hypothetical protein
MITPLDTRPFEICNAVSRDTSINRFTLSNCMNSGLLRVFIQTWERENTVNHVPDQKKAYSGNVR